MLQENYACLYSSVSYSSLFFSFYDYDGNHSLMEIVFLGTNFLKSEIHH